MVLAGCALAFARELVDAAERLAEAKLVLSCMPLALAGAGNLQLCSIVAFRIPPKCRGALCCAELLS